jgi:hypothetical protein
VFVVVVRQRCNRRCFDKFRFNFVVGFQRSYFDGTVHGDQRYWDGDCVLLSGDVFWSSDCYGVRCKVIFFYIYDINVCFITLAIDYFLVFCSVLQLISPIIQLLVAVLHLIAVVVVAAAVEMDVAVDVAVEGYVVHLIHVTPVLAILSR